MVKDKNKKMIENIDLFGFSRKGNATWVLTTMIVSVLGFFVYLSFFANIAGGLVSETDDLTCRMFLAAKDNVAVQAGELFFFDLKQKCKKDEIEKTVKGKDEVFNVIGDSMKRCWYRYGESEYDFLSFWNKEGSWCFTCATINVEDEENVGTTYDYNEFIQWANSSKSEFKLRNGTEVKLAEYLTLMYAHTDDESNIIQVREDINTLLAEGEGYTQTAALKLDGDFQKMQDLRLKEIATGEELYVVYRYDKRDDSLLENLKQGTTGMIIGASLSIGTSMAAEFAIDKAMTLTVCASSLLFPPSGFVCGAAIFKSVASTLGSIKDMAKLQKLRKLIETTSDFFTKTIRFTNKAKSLKAVDSFTGSIDDFPAIIKTLKKVDPDLATKMIKIEENMKDLGIKHIEDLNFEILKKNDKLDKLKDLSLNVAGKELSYNKNFVDRVTNLRDSYNVKLADFTELEDEVIEVFGRSDYKKVLEDSSDKFDKVKKYLTIGVVGGAAGGVTATNMNFNNNQYVDVMTKEQYYRNCGTERMSYD